jgi:hypothetical protein
MVSTTSQRIAVVQSLVIAMSFPTLLHPCCLCILCCVI